ncbi:flagellar protein [Paenibacillus sp. S3N08]|uniref:Flagellar protein n=2 Tax=Paenibacillus agricola TaxID=2716264 RepID=A0ABX0IXW5_9BACL|nr:flagellar protein [Paenibacillus agricola]
MKWGRVWHKPNYLSLFAAIQTAGFSSFASGEAGASSSQQPNSTPEFTYTGVSTSETMWMVVQVIFFLIIIIGLFFLIIKFLSRKNKTLFGRSLRSLGGVPLGPNKSIQVVEIGHSLYIVGVGDNIQLLEKVDNEEEVAYISEMLTSSNSMGVASFQTFSGWLTKLRKKQPEVEELDTDLSDASFQEIFHNKMHHLSDRKKMVEEVLMEDKNKDRLNDKQ